MKITVLEDNPKVIEKIKAQVDNISFYQDKNIFINESKKFDVALIANKFINKELVDKISNLEIGVLNKRGAVGYDDERIALIIDDVENLGEKLKYFDAKIRINTILDFEQNSLKNMKELANKVEHLRESELEKEKISAILNCSYYLEIKDGIAVLEVKDVLNYKEKTDIFSVIKNANYKLAIYLNVNTISSLHLGIIAYLWKEISENKGKMVYWNKNKDVNVINLLELCRIDKILSIVGSFDEVKKLLE